MPVNDVSVQKLMYTAPEKNHSVSLGTQNDEDDDDDDGGGGGVQLRKFHSEARYITSLNDSHL